MCDQCQIPNPCNRAKAKLANTNQQADPCMYYTLKFLINNALGENHRKTKDEIINYLNSVGCIITSQEVWSTSILQELKDERIVATDVYPGNKGGVFIPCNISDLNMAISNLEKRIGRETKHLNDYRKIKNGL